MSSKIKSLVKEIDYLKRKTKSFYLAFFLFHLVIGAISLWLVFFGLTPTKLKPQNGSPPRNPCRRERMSSFENLYHRYFLFDFYAFLSEKEDGAFDRERQLIWSMQNLTYYGDSRLFLSFSHNVTVSRVSSGFELISSSKVNLSFLFQHLQDHGSLYLHILLTKSGVPPGPRKDETSPGLYTFHKTARLNFFWRSNGNDASSEVRSYWRPNWAVNLLVHDSLWELPFNEEKSAKEPIIECNMLWSKYYPVLYLNDKL